MFLCSPSLYFRSLQPSATYGMLNLPPPSLSIYISFSTHYTGIVGDLLFFRTCSYACLLSFCESQACVLPLISHLRPLHSAYCPVPLMSHKHVPAPVQLMMRAFVFNFSVHIVYAKNGYLNSDQLSFVTCSIFSQTHTWFSALRLYIFVLCNHRPHTACWTWPPPSPSFSTQE